MIVAVLTISLWKKRGFTIDAIRNVVVRTEAFLASDRAGFITGASIDVGGGQGAHV